MCSNSELDACDEDMIPLSFTVKPDWQAQIVPNQSVKASYATDGGARWGLPQLESSPDLSEGHKSVANHYSLAHN